MSLSFGRVTDEWHVAVADGPDIGHEQDIRTPHQVTATFTPLVSVHQRAQIEAESRNISFIMTTLSYTYQNGVLVGAHGEDGVTLIAELNGEPIYWRITRSVRPTAGGASVSIPPINVHPTPGGTIHLPTVVSIPDSQVPDMQEVHADVAGLIEQVTSLETAVSGMAEDIPDAQAVVNTVVQASQAATQAAQDAVAAAVVSGVRDVTLPNPTTAEIQSSLDAMPAGSTVTNMATGEVWGH